MLYAVNEVEFFPEYKFKKALKRRQTANTMVANSQADTRPLFRGYVGSHNNQFQKRYNAFLLFMLNNSQDELLMAYTDFCKKCFTAGLPDRETGALPQKYTNGDIKDLRAFVAREDILSENQFKYIITKNLDKDDNWKRLNEKDHDGAAIRWIKFSSLLPFIMLGFFCYLTKEVDERLSRIANLTADNVEAQHKGQGLGSGNDKKTGLVDCFKKAGLKQTDWFTPVVTYSMTENALLYYMDNNNLTRDQVELILRMTRERMEVHPMTRLEKQKEYFDHTLPRKSFGRWLMAEIALQMRLNRLAKEQFETKLMNRERFKRALINEEKMTQIAINIDKLDYNRFIKLVTKNLMIIIHARRKYGIFLDLHQHNSVKEALMAQLEIESKKAKDSIYREYKPLAEERSIQAKQVEDIL